MLRCAVAHVGTLLPQPPRAWKNLEADDGRRKSLADKGCCRRSVVVQAVGGAGARGASSLEKVPGREDYASDEEGALEWGKASSL